MSLTRMGGLLSAARVWRGGSGRGAVIYPLAFLANVGFGCLSLGLLFYAQDVFRASPAEACRLPAFYFLAYIFGCVFFRPLFDRLLPRHTLLFATGSMCVISLLIPVAGGMAVLYGLQVVLGLAVSIFWPVAMGWVSLGREGVALSKSLGRFNVSWSAGTILGPFLGGRLSEFASVLPIRAATGVFATMFGLTLLACLALPGIRRDSGRPSAAPPAPASGARQTPLRYAAWVGLWCAFVGVGVLSATFAVSARIELGLSKSLIGLLLLVRMLATTCAFHPIGRMPGWHFKSRPMLLNQLTFALVLLLVARVQSAWSIGALFVCAGSCIAFAYATSVFHGVAGSANRGRRMAIHESVLAAGYMVGAALGGELYEAFSMPVVYAVVAGVLVCGTLVQAGIALAARPGKDGATACVRKPDARGFDADEMFGWVKDMARLGPRRPGSPADHENEAYLADKLRSFGLDQVRLEPMEIDYWEPARGCLEIDEGAGFSAWPAQWIPHTAFTAESGAEGGLVYAAPDRLLHGGDWRGKIVATDISFPPLDMALLKKFALGSFDPDASLADISHPATWVRLNWHLYRKAARRGAAGFVGIIKDQPGGSHRMFAPYGFKEKDIRAKPIPGFWVGRDQGAGLRELARGGRARARLTLTGRVTQATTSNVLGVVPGQTDELVVVSCHHDSPFESPVEDASGCAVVLGLARHFAENPGLNRGLLVLFTAGHFYGSIGTRTFIREHARDILPNVALEITIEHIAKEAVEGEDGKLVFSGRPEGAGVFVPFNRRVTDVVLRQIQAHDVRRTLLLPAEGPLGDYPPTDGGDWYAAGVPVINYISNPVYLLNAEDSLDWVMQERLPKVGAAFAGIIRELDEIPKPALASEDLKRFKLKMKLIKLLARAKTTRLGTRPVY